MKKDFFSQKEKETVFVTFPASEIGLHSGIRGLKYYLTVMYMRKHLQTFGEVSLTIGDLMDECGYSVRTHNPNTHCDFRNIIINEIIGKGFAECSNDVMTVAQNEMFYLRFLQNGKNIFGHDGRNVKVSISDFEKITRCTENINKAVLIGTYIAVKPVIARMDYGQKISEIQKRNIKKRIGLNSAITVGRAIGILEGMGMVNTEKRIIQSEKG